jgi:hypothetical protein
LEIDRFRIDPERFIETELGIESPNRCGWKRFFSVPRAAGSAVHEKKRDRGNGNNHGHDPENSAKCILQHFPSSMTFSLALFAEE